MKIFEVKNQQVLQIISANIHNGKKWKNVILQREKHFSNYDIEYRLITIYNIYKAKENLLMVVNVD